jgi:hypothetical protein
MLSLRVHIVITGLQIVNKLLNGTVGNSSARSSSNEYTGNPQKNGGVLIVNTIKTAPFFCVCLVYTALTNT